MPKFTQLLSSRTENTTHVSKLWNQYSFHCSMIPPFCQTNFHWPQWIIHPKAPKVSLPSLKLPQCGFIIHHVENSQKGNPCCWSSLGLASCRHHSTNAGGATQSWCVMKRPNKRPNQDNSQKHFLFLLSTEMGFFSALASHKNKWRIDYLKTEGQKHSLKYNDCERHIWVGPGKELKQTS